MTPHYQETTFVLSMAGSAVWTVMSGDTLIPSVAGASMAVAFRLMNRDGGHMALFDLIAIFAISTALGMIAGPWVADQLPEGRGVTGVGTLFASFVGVRTLQALHEVNWDFGAFFGKLAEGFKGKK
jgi:hypothetical protein